MPARFAPIASAAVCLAMQAPHHPSPPNPLLLRAEVSGPRNEKRVHELALDVVDLMRPCELDQTLELPPPLPSIHVLRFLPLAALEQRLVEDPTGRAGPAARISIDGPKLHYVRCLSAGDPERDRIRSLIGAWRLVAVSNTAERDRLLDRFRAEPHRAPTLSIGLPTGEVYRIPATPGRTKEFKDLGYTVRIVEFFSNYARDPATGEPVNESDALRNPAVLLEVDGPGGTARSWAFARFPEFKADPALSSPFEFALDSPIEAARPTPDILLVAGPDRGMEAWVRVRDEVRVHPVVAERPIEVPGSQYSFSVLEAPASAHLVEEYVPTEDLRSGQTVVEIRIGDEPAADARPRWLILGKPAPVAGTGGALVLTLDRNRERESSGGHTSEGRPR